MNSRDRTAVPRRSLHTEASATIRRYAFTLVELLVVIAILSLIAAIAFPVFARVREKARATACLSNCRQIAAGIVMYVQDYDETYPAAANISAAINSQWPHLRSIVTPYVRNGDIWWCPDEERPSPWDSVTHPIPAFNDPAFQGAGTSYAYKSRSESNGNRAGNLAGHPVSDLANPASLWLFWDADSDYSRHTTGLKANFPGGDCAWRSKAGQIAAFADGHAKLELRIPYPQYWENMTLDGQEGIPPSWTGCP